MVVKKAKFEKEKTHHKCTQITLETKKLGAKHITITH
jgi:hypothetical protein